MGFIMCLNMAFWDPICIETQKYKVCVWHFGSCPIGIVLICEQLWNVMKCFQTKNESREQVIPMSQMQNR